MATALLGAISIAACDNGSSLSDPDSPQLADGQQIFRFDTFGDETFWTDTLRIHEIVQTGVSPRTALAVGLKVDADALPPGTLEGADLDAPATTVALLKLNAVVGLQGTVANVNGKDTLDRQRLACRHSGVMGRQAVTESAVDRDRFDVGQRRRAEHHTGRIVAAEVQGI
jgi:hypothetical protein